MKNSSENEFKGPLKYNREVDVSWGDAIVYSDLASDVFLVEEIDDTVIEPYKQELYLGLEVRLIDFLI